MVTPDLIWTTDVNYWGVCNHEMNVAQNISGILLRSLVTLYHELEYAGLGLVLWYLQIWFETPPTSISFPGIVLLQQKDTYCAK